MKTFIAFFTIAILNCSIIFAGTGAIDNSGNMDFSVNFRYPPTPADLINVRNALIQANNIICDVTDGQARFRNITLTAGADGEDQADIWIFAEVARSGVSFFTNGSGFGTLGYHINLFQGGIVGSVIAHELGHLAFGLGDEYDEQCRWGGPCGIGPCFDAGAINGQNNSLMQQAAIDQTEFCVALNHDMTLGDNVICPGARCMPSATCTDANCQQNFNSVTLRFETSQQEQMHPGLSCWETIDQNYSSVFTPPPGLPVALQPTTCGTPTFIEEVSGTDQIMLFIDRSGSMRDRINNDPNSVTKMDFAKAAARAFIDLQAGSTSMVGLISFEESPRLDRRLIDLNPADVTGLKNTVNGLIAGGWTGIGTALTASVFEFQAVRTSGRNRTAFLLSDGENTHGEDPRVSAQRLRNEGVRIFTIPVGSAADRSLMSDIAGTSGGVMLDAPIGDELPPIYFEFFARYKGESLILPRKQLSVAPSKRERNDSLQQIDTVSFNVEVLATKLNILISTRNSDIRNWNMLYELKGPSGELYTNSNTGIVTFDPYYMLIRLNNPSAGKWTLGVRSGNSSNQFGYAIAFVENPKPDLFADANPKIVGSNEKVTISTQAVYGADLEDGVIYNGTVKRPDGVIVPISFNKNELTRNVFTEFSNFNGRGIYEVTVSCKVTSTASILKGESIFTGPEIPAISIFPFERSTTTWFYLKNTQLPPCYNNDCDNDGIDNGIEGTLDTDGDGLPDDRDSDSDGDDVPDSEEGTKDSDGDGTPDYKDRDSDNDGILDGNDTNNEKEPRSNGKLYYSFHVGSAHPLGNLNKTFDADIHAHLNISYYIKPRISLEAIFGINQFTPLLGQILNVNWYNLSLNGKFYFPFIDPGRKIFVNGGPGYFFNNNSNEAGFNIGLGLQYDVKSNLKLEFGIDYNQIEFNNPIQFFSIGIGVMFR